MLKSQTILLLLSLLAITFARDDWVLTWSDEFDGLNVDPSKWKFEIGNVNGWGNNELEYYTGDASNVFVQDGKLIIQANKEKKDGFNYTSTRMNTASSISTDHSRVEARVKLPTGKGIWPAFWMLGQNIGEVGWPACGEIDIMEWIGRDPNNIRMSTHGTGFWTSTPFTKDRGWDDGNFHTFGVIRQTDRIEFYVDGQTTATVTPADLNGAAWPFNNKNMFILLDLAVGGNWNGPPDDSTQFPQQYIVDYVRVYQKESKALTTSKAGRRVCKKRNLRRR